MNIHRLLEGYPRVAVNAVDGILPPKPPSSIGLEKSLHGLSLFRIQQVFGGT